MSLAAWVLWFTAQAIVLVAILAIAVLGATDRLSRARRARTPARRAARRRHHHHLTFRHRPAR